MIRIIPVMDVMNGLVVHAIAGKRNEYKPIYNSVISNSPRPEDVLRGFIRLGCRSVYIADLDAILGRGNNEYVITTALLYGFTILADIGRKGFEKNDNENLTYVLGTEYTIYPNELNLLSNRVVSLDIKNRKVIFRNIDIDIVQAAIDVCKQNPKMVIVLNLDRVGTELGIDIDTLGIVKNFCNTVIAIGGGLRTIRELNLLRDLGVKYVLVATAIHKGIIDRCEY